MDKFPITIEGYKKAEEELKNLKLVKRPEIIEALSRARELGDLSENAEYNAARETYGLIEGRITELESIIVRSEIIDISKLSGNKIKFGAKVKLINEETEEEESVQIVGEYEIRMIQEHISDNHTVIISINSPLGRALIGREIGDIIEVKAPNGFKNYEILSFNY